MKYITKKKRLKNEELDKRKEKLEYVANTFCENYKKSDVIKRSQRFIVCKYSFNVLKFEYPSNKNGKWKIHCYPFVSWNGTDFGGLECEIRCCYDDLIKYISSYSFEFDHWILRTSLKQLTINYSYNVDINWLRSRFWWKRGLRCF